MPPQDVGPADDWDIWLRNITNKNHLRKDGRLKSNAFTGKAISPRQPGRPWDHELSGRLLSLTNDFDAEGRAFCETKGMTFMGVMYASVQALRQTVNTVATDVNYTRTADDNAHADLTMIGSNDDNLGAVRDWLQETVTVSLPNPICAIASEFPQRA
jgi:hypothetical protein